MSNNKAYATSIARLEARLAVATNTVEQKRAFLLKAKAGLEESLQRIPENSFNPPTSS